MLLDPVVGGAAPAGGGTPPFKTNPPHSVGGAGPNPPIGTRMLAGPRRQFAVAPQNIGDRARCRNLKLTLARHNPSDLASAPGVVAALTDAQHLGLHRILAARRTVMRSTRTIGQSRSTLRQIPRNPLVPIAARNTKPPTQFQSVRSNRQRQLHKLLSLLHHRTLPPRHRRSSSPTNLNRTSVLDVPVRCPRCPRSIHSGGGGPLELAWRANRGGGGA